MKEVKMLTGSGDTPGMLRGDESLVRGLLALLSKRAVLKRTFDILVAGFFLAVVAPLCAILAVLIKLDSPGPVIFRQRRVGRNGQAYTMYKFRSMFCGVEGIHRPGSSERDPRLTRVGRLIRRLYLDELPQLFNVLKGRDERLWISSGVS
jgi:lipopolysaccharide/colanic/teichoic acid biosynthesis glycosyltransferase